MRGNTTLINHKAQRMAKLQHVSRRNIGSHNHCGLISHGMRAGAACESTQHTIGNLLHIAATLTKILVFDRFKLSRKLCRLCRQSPLSAPARLTNRLRSLPGKRWVVEQHGMDFE